MAADVMRGSAVPTETLDGGGGHARDAGGLALGYRVTLFASFPRLRSPGHSCLAQVYRDQRIATTKSRTQ